MCLKTGLSGSECLQLTRFSIKIGSVGWDSTHPVFLVESPPITAFSPRFRAFNFPQWPSLDGLCVCLDVLAADRDTAE